MPQTRLIRTLRGAVAAALATFVALFFHVAGGGQVPAAAGVLVPLLLSTFVCVLLSGRRLALWRLTVSVAASQLLFHGLFVLGTGGSTVPSVQSVPGSHAGHLAGLVLSVPGMPHDTAGAGMWVAHAVAALLTVAALHRGERVIAQLLAFTGYVLARIARALHPAVLTPVRPRRTGAAWFEHRPTPLGVFATVCLQRGPPAVAGS